MFAENKTTEFRREYVKILKTRLLPLQTVTAVHPLSE